MDKEKVSFGSIAIELGLVTHERVMECIMIQNQMRALGIVPKMIGEIMLDKGFINEDGLRKIIYTQAQKEGRIQILGYKIIQEIGRGAMGMVYKGMQLSLERIVAIKVLSPRFAEDMKYVERFLKEAKSVARLNHQNIVQAIDAGISSGVYYFAMEFVDGPTLSYILRRGGAMDEKRALNIITNIAMALQHFDKYGFVHRDIKPSNIMLTAGGGMAKLCDLGVAKVPVKKEGDESQQNVLVGTPNYISPEQARGEEVDIRSDIYSLGCTFYHAVAGEVPFKSENSMSVVMKHLYEQAVPPRDKNSLVSVEINDIIMRMLAKNKAERYQKPEELVIALEEAMKKQEAALLQAEEDKNASQQRGKGRFPRVSPRRRGSLKNKRKLK